MTTSTQAPPTVEFIMKNRRPRQGDPLLIEIRIHNAGRRALRVPVFTFDDPAHTSLVIGLFDVSSGRHIGPFGSLDVLGSQGLNIPRELHIEPGEVPTTTLRGGETATIPLDLAKLTGPLAPGKYLAGVDYDTFDGLRSDELEFEVVAK